MKKVRCKYTQAMKKLGKHKKFQDDNFKKLNSTLFLSLESEYNYVRIT